MESADQIALVVTTVESEIRSDATSPTLYPHLGHVQQMVYRRLVAQPDLRQAVYLLLEEPHRTIAQRHVDAGEKLTKLTKPVSTIPAWQIIEPPSPDELRGYYGMAEQEFGVPWAYLAAIHLVETRMGRIRGTSSAGAQGPMQFIPSTWQAYGEGDINDPLDSIRAAARYLKASGASTDMRRALWAYNHSYNYVDAIETYARFMLEDERTYRAYHAWQVYVRTTEGDKLLPVGYGAG